MENFIKNIFHLDYECTLEKKKNKKKIYKLDLLEYLTVNDKINKIKEFIYYEKIKKFTNIFYHLYKIFKHNLKYDYKLTYNLFYFINKDLDLDIIVILSNLFKFVNFIIITENPNITNIKKKKFEIINITRFDKNSLSKIYFKYNNNIDYLSTKNILISYYLSYPKNKALINFLKPDESIIYFFIPYNYKKKNIDCINGNRYYSFFSDDTFPLVIIRSSKPYKFIKINTNIYLESIYKFSLKKKYKSYFIEKYWMYKLFYLYNYKNKFIEHLKLNNNFNEYQFIYCINTILNDDLFKKLKFKDKDLIKLINLFIKHN